jgi:hypothetical protein
MPRNIIIVASYSLTFKVSTYYLCFIISVGIYIAYVLDGHELNSQNFHKCLR